MANEFKKKKSVFTKMAAKTTSGSSFCVTFVFYALDLVENTNNVEKEQCNGGPKRENTHLLQMSHVAWSCVCLSVCVGNTGELCKNGSKESCISWCPDPPRKGVLLRRDMRQPTVTYLRMSGLRTVHLPPRANVPVQRTRRTNTFAAAKSDKTAMQHFARLLWTLIIIIIIITI